MLFVPWALISAWRARWLWLRSVETAALTLVIGFMTLLFVRWGVVLLIIWLS
jgi:hypothetical protein